MQTHDKNAILFSHTVKAGRRVYFIDVKQDRRGDHYLSITESKRVQEGTGLVPPVFEKHKVFLYRRDFSKFAEALQEAMDYVSQLPMPEEDAAQTQAAAEGDDEMKAEDYQFNVDFE